MQKFYPWLHMVPLSTGRNIPKAQNLEYPLRMSRWAKTAIHVVQLVKNKIALWNGLSFLIHIEG